MNTANLGEIRPILPPCSQASITEALLLADAATGLLEKNPNPESVNAAGKALLQSAALLLFEGRGPVVVIPGELQRQLYCTLMNAHGALDLVLENIADIDAGGGSAAVVDLLRGALALQAEKIDEFVLRRAGLLIEWPKAASAGGGDE